MRITRFTILAFLTLLTGSFFTHAQSSPVASRVTNVVDESVLTTLHGNVTVRAQPEFDQGEAASGTQLTHIRLVLKRSDAQQAALSKFMAQQLDSSSPNYHHWLTPEQMGRIYGLSDNDISALTNWIEYHGLKVESVSKARTHIYFSGTVAQVEELLHTQIHSFNVRGEQFYSNISEPQIPAALAPVVSGVAHLNTVAPRSFSKKGTFGIQDPETKQLKPAAQATGVAKPNLTITSNGNTNLYITPMDAATIYDTPNTTFNVNYSGTTYDGTGATIGIGGTSSVLTTTLGNFHTGFMNSAATHTTEVDTGAVSVPSIGAQDEAYLDLELSSGMAPGASIIYYPSSDLVSGITTAIDANNVDIFSLSYGACEWFLDSADNTSFVLLWEQAAAQGISVTVSTGDSGSAGCDDPNTYTTAIYGAQVNGFASTPFNIAVGGTDFYDLVNSFGSYVSSTNNATYSGSAKGPIPESAWNESTASPFISPYWATSADSYVAYNVPWNAVNPTYSNSIWAGSGGPSWCSSNTTTYGIGGGPPPPDGVCIGGYAKPAWQSGVTGIPADGARDLPDVSLMAGSGQFGASWLACTDDPITGQAGVYSNCNPTNPNTNYFAAFGGTSAAAPSFAGILAQVKQKVNGRLGQAASELYALASGGSASTIFHFTTIGNNSVDCDPTTTPDGSCVLNTAGYYFQSGYNTATEYNLSTGLGSVDAKELVGNWPSVTGLGSFTISATDVTVTAGATTGNTSNITITPSGNYSGTVTWTAYITSAPTSAVGDPTFSYAPTGGLTFTNGGAAQNGTVTVNTTGTTALLRKTDNYEYADNRSNWFKAAGGMVLASFLLFFVPGRVRKARRSLMTLMLLVACGFTVIGCGGGSSGGSTYLTPNVAVVPASSTVAYSSPLNVTINVTGTGAKPTGTVTLTSGSYSSALTSLSSGSATVTIPAGTFKKAGTYNLTANYSGDTTYSSGTGSASEKVTGPATTTGSYTVKVVAVGSDAASTTKSTTFALTVN
jgi:hypothetical protein